MVKKTHSVGCLCLGDFNSRGDSSRQFAHLQPRPDQFFVLRGVAEAEVEGGQGTGTGNERRARDKWDEREKAEQSGGWEQVTVPFRSTGGARRPVRGREARAGSRDRRQECCQHASTPEIFISIQRRSSAALDKPSDTSRTVAHRGRFKPGRFRVEPFNQQCRHPTRPDVSITAGVKPYDVMIGRKDS